MATAVFIGVLIVSYLLGSIPFGLVLVRIVKGEDIRKIQSGRTGGTNAMRAAGFWVGFATALLDILKGAASVWIAGAVLPDSVWLKVLAPLCAIIGHNYSVFLLERTESGRFKLGGGAGGAPCLGGSVGIWPWSFVVIFPLGLAVLFGIGYASVTTMSVALISTAIFIVLAIFYGWPWEFIVYGLLAEALLMWSLRPNIKRLLNGTERKVGWRAKKADSQQG